LNLGASLESGGVLPGDFGSVQVPGTFDPEGGKATLLHTGGVVSGTIWLDGGTLTLYNERPATDGQRRSAGQKRRHPGR
jgi:hypothetical protein